MKPILCTLFILLTSLFIANAQSKILEQKQKYNFMLRAHRNLQNVNSNAKLKLNPYWQSVDAPHTNNSYIPQIKVPVFGVVWSKLNYDSLPYDANNFLRTVDNGKTWHLDSVTVPQGYGLGSLSAIDGNICYASMYHAMDGKGGGIFKTTDGGVSWKKLGIGQLFSDSVFVNFVYFFNAKNGIAVGDNNGVDTSYLEIYTTADAGKTWRRVPNANMQPITGSAFSFYQNVYTVFQNRIWFKTVDSQGNQYLNRSDDFGRHWQLFPFNIPEFGFDFAFANKQNGIAVGFPFDGIHNSFEAVTHDGGETWTQKTDFAGYVMGGFVTVIPGTHTYVSTLPFETPVYGSSYSRDGGNSWTLVDSGANAKHSAVAFLNPLHGWTGRAETYTDDPSGGAFKWKYHFDLNDNANADNNAKALPVISSVANTSVNARLYPNPAKDVVKIDGLNPSVKTTLSLYNTSGKPVQQATVTGSNYTLHLQNLSAGTYYIKIQTGEKLSTLMFVKE